MNSKSEVSGYATLSSTRVQKAFSRNFRENKLLKGAVKLLENDHIRHLRNLKQDIKDTAVWLEKIRESSGHSEHGRKPDTPLDEKRKSIAEKSPIIKKRKDDESEPTNVSTQVVTSKI